jgi:choline kinase
VSVIRPIRQGASIRTIGMLHINAVILAAGSGMRLRSVSGEVPKGLVNVAGKTALERAIDNLTAYGVRDISLVTGFKEQAYAEAAREVFGKYHLQLKFLYNARWSEYNNWYSALLGLEGAGEGDVLLINSDVLFQREILLRLLLAQPPATTLAIDSLSDLDDETMKVQVNDGQVMRISKGIPVGDSQGEFIGLSLVSAGDRQEVCQALAELEATNPNGYYEDAFDKICTRLKPSVLDIKGLLWTEIDTPDDLTKAETLFGRNGASGK